MERKKENINWATEEVLEIVTCINYPKHQCTYGHQCKFLHHRITSYTLNSKEDISNSPNQSLDFQNLLTCKTMQVAMKTVKAKTSKVN